ncbi:MAG: hypothetical protein CHACPFDD_02289 [Phycisphaerae bacterium]|nr:hypothetical protein [Phycisphaerae bacterium]
MRALERKPEIRARSLAASAEMLCHAVAPELAGRPVYIVLRSDLPRDWAGGEDYASCTIAHLDLILRSTLERKRRWRGRGPAILIDAAAIAAAARYRPRTARKRVFLPALLSIVLHELAHVIDMEFVPKREPDDWWVRAGRRLFSEPAAPDNRPTNGPGAPVPWRMHEWPFIRIAMHLAERASAAGISVSPRDVIDLGEYGLSSTFQYALALGDEPARMAGCDFEAIRRATPPTAFTELWWADVERWVSQAEMTNEIPMTLAACMRQVSSPRA